MYISYYILMYNVKKQTYANFFQLPTDQQILNYTDYEIEDAKTYGYELPPLQPTMSNILYYWEDGNGTYNGLKLLLVIPVTIHLAYIISNYWWTQFKVHASYTRAKRPEDASHALVFLKVKTGLTNDIQQLHFLKIHHFIYNNKFYNEITFENEKYYITLENNIPKLVKKFQESKSRIPNVHHGSDGLSCSEHYTQLQNYGENRIYLQYPKYSKILGDQLLSPYFAFQVFTSVLYGLDNFMTYALFQFSFLFLNEGATMFSKYNSLKQVCKLAPKPTKVNVLRDGQEEIISSASLVPGDIVILKADDYNNLDSEEEEEIVEPKPFQPNEQIMQIPMFKLLFRLKEIIFGKYQDPSVWQDLDKLERSPILPTDFILMDGQVITDESILTGEQTSQIKEAIEKLDEEQIQPFNYLYAGTTIVQVQSETAKLLVTKTALQTEQGGLIKTIAFNDERMNITTKDSIIFLAIMCVVALFSSGYTFKRGFDNNVCALNKLCLETLMIFVSVIPPDLPTELAMCIGNSIKDMRQKKIFSSDPYKILNAGRIKYICFDKSGTLTQSGIKIIGVDDKISQITQYDMISSKASGKQKECATYIQQLINQKYSDNAKLVLACCQSLSQVKGKVLGDVLEVSQFAFVQGKFKGKDFVQFGDKEATISRRFFFNSTLKRMSVVARSNGRMYLLMKGSPEAVRELLNQVPTDYDEAVDRYNLFGYRVLALGFRELNNEEASFFDQGDVKLQREDLEKGLTFAGLLICQTPLKTDTIESIQILKGAGHYVKVISGDHVINLAVCCRNCGIFDPHSIPVIIQSLDISGDQIKKVTWSSIDKPGDIKEGSLDQFLSQNKAICVTNSNDVIKILLSNQNKQIQQLFNEITGFGRTTPQQKQQIVDRYQNQSTESRVMFVGDGVNDLNALQAADIGVALVEMTQDGKPGNNQTDNKKNKGKAKQPDVIIPYPSIMGPNNTPASYFDIVREAQQRAQRKRTDPRAELQILMTEQARYKQYLKIQRAKKMQANNEIFGMWNDAFETEAERDAPELGEATIAAAFTVKGVSEDASPNASNLSGVLDVIRQGRCALSSVQMSFKTTALRCLTSAYQLTALTLNGVRSSDSQMIFGAILSIFVMLYVNKCKQQKIISKKRPPRSIVGLYLVSSMFLQAFVHVAAVYIAQFIADAPQTTMKLNTKFTPTLVNTVVFYVTMVQEVAVVLVNYPGKPHMQSILEHRKLCLAIFAYCVSVIVLVTEQVPELNEKLGLVSLSQEMQIQILTLCFVDCALAFLVEKASALLFS